MVYPSSNANIVTPSIPYICYAIFRFLANHPLLVHPLVKHPVTGQDAPIAYWTFTDGFTLDDIGEGVACSIYPGYVNANEAPPTPTTNAASVIYRPYDLGSNHQEALYHFVIKFSRKEICFDGSAVEPNPAITETPLNAVIDPSIRGLVNNFDRKRVKLNINPSLHIVGNYLELCRLALNDVYHYEDFPIQVSSIQPLYQNYSSKWESGKNVYLQEGMLYVQLAAYVSMGWRDKFILPLTNIVTQVEGLELEVETEYTKNAGQLSVIDYEKQPCLNNPVPSPGPSPSPSPSPSPAPDPNNPDPFPQYIDEFELEEALDDLRDDLNTFDGGTF